MPFWFQSSPAPKGRCNLMDPSPMMMMLCFNPHRPRRADATRIPGEADHPDDVSILTGPEGPMQPMPITSACAVATVSILTGPEGPMQREQARLHTQARGFQSSPAPKGRCNADPHSTPDFALLFQSSPAPKGRCNSPFCRTQCGKERFNPHRPRRADATSLSRPSFHPPLFQSSPAPKGRCNSLFAAPVSLQRCFNPHRPRRADATRPHRHREETRYVSILTGPEGPMQHRRGSDGDGQPTVSILTGPEGPMQR